MEKITELIPVNGRKSFGHKAKLIETSNHFICVSYNTKVATYLKKSKKLYFAPGFKSWYSNTTKTHIDSFLSAVGLAPMTKQQIKEAETKIF